MMFSVTPPSVIIASTMLCVLREVSSWVLPSSSLNRRLWSPRLTTIVESSRPSIFFEDEYECPEEDECEIDWSSMPGFDDDKEEVADAEKSKISYGFEPDCPNEDECEIDWDMMPGFAEDENESKESKVEAFVSDPVNSIESDPDCPEEEECEIDWSMMPGFDDDEDEESDESKIELSIVSDPDCPDEEECEIDWSMMPGFDDDEDDEIEKEETENVLSDKGQNFQAVNEKLDELEPQTPYVRQGELSVEKARKHLQMNWQIEDCIANEDRCTDFCSECAGSGRTFCKFCNGTAMVSFGNEMRTCILCKDGRVECTACSGTGSISPWAKTHDGN